MQTPAKFTRSMELIRFELFDEITVLGGGGIGSFLVQLLAIMGFKRINLYEYDTVEIHNTGCGVFSESDVGKTKFEVLRTIATSHGSTIVPMGKFEEGSTVTRYMAICPDDLPVRKLAYDLWRATITDGIFVDGRMGGTVVEVHAEHSCMPCEYLSTINPDAVAEADCARKHTIFTGSYAATLMALTISAMIQGNPFRKFMHFNTAPFYDMNNERDVRNLVCLEENSGDQSTNG